MTKLSVNLNAVAQLRNRRDIGWPSVTGIACVVLDAGAAGVTVHPRPDERHIRRSDVFELAALLRADYPEAEFNIEGYPTEDFLRLVEENKPDQVTFVPDDPSQATSDHGWDIPQNADFLRTVIGRMKGQGFRVALFADADPSVPQLAADVGADRIEIYTGPYGACFETSEGAAELDKISQTVEAAISAGVGVNAGHDLKLENLPDFIAAAPRIDEVSIGHGLTADALLYGFAEAVRHYLRALSR